MGYDLTNDGKGANISGTQLLTGQAHFDVMSGEPYFLSRLICGRFNSLDISLGSLSAHCTLQVVMNSFPRPSHSLENNDRLMGHPMFPWTTGTVEAGSLAHTERE